MNEKKLITCIICPRGCQIQAWEEEGELKLIGYNCKRGKTYSTNEYYHPSRILTSTITIKGARLPLIPIRSSKPVPKDRLMDVMDELAQIQVKAPVKMGDTLVKNILNLNLDIVATRSLDEIHS